MINKLVTRWDDLVLALWQHIQLTTFALVIAAILAISLAIWALRHRRIAEIFLQITGILQTIPSLAVLALMIPIVGIGFPAALTALVVYALLPIFQNTYLGLSQVQPELIDSAAALGLPRNKILWKVRFPLATPNIIAGLRTATVMIVGTGTLAALIGAGGLGSFILLGIDRNDNNLLLIGAITSALLAILATLLIQIIGKTRGKLRWTIVIGLLGTITVGTFVPKLVSQQSSTVVIAGKLGSEPTILIEMYKDLIQADDPHVKVITKDSLGTTSFLYNALKSDDIDIYPEFTGTILSDIARKPATLPKGASAETTYAAAKKVAKNLNLTVGKPTKFNDTYAIAVSSSAAKKYGLTTIGDLHKLPNASAGMTAEFLDRTDGWPGIAQTYDLTDIPTTSFDPTLRYQAIAQGKVSIVDAYSTDSQLKQYHLQVLQDDQRFFPAYQAVPLMKNAFAKKHPDYVQSLNKLAGKITDADMQEMNYLVNVKHEPASKVAKDYLVEHHILAR